MAQGALLVAGRPIPGRPVRREGGDEAFWGPEKRKAASGGPATKGMVFGRCLAHGAFWSSNSWNHLPFGVGNSVGKKTDLGNGPSFRAYSPTSTDLRFHFITTTIHLLHTTSTKSYDKKSINDAVAVRNLKRRQLKVERCCSKNTSGVLGPPSDLPVFKVAP